jgi:RHS repeat-associated protein
LIAQTRPQPSPSPALNFYVFDGHGNVRALTDGTGAVTDTYDYDAFGNLIHSTGTTPNNYLFAGEQFDPDLNLYYNRARYLSTSTGRFWNTDTFEGDAIAPISLHKYLYASADPVNRIDPEGQEDADVSSNLISASGKTILATIAALKLKHVHRLTSESALNWNYESADAISQKERTGGYLQNSTAAQKSASLGVFALIRSMRQHRRLLVGAPIFYSPLEGPELC